jgi:hypothetical protein
MAQGVDPEFKPQYQKKRERNNNTFLDLKLGKMT